MNPHLQYAQAIHGRTTGRGIGIIDTIHLVEVARAIEVLEPSAALTPAERVAVRQWFADYLTWMTTHPNGIEEREAKNNHGTCWVMQVAAFAHLTGNEPLLADARAALQDGPRPGPDGRRRQLPAGAEAHEAVRLFALQPRRIRDDRADPLDAARQPVDLRAAGRPRPAQGRRLHGAVHPRQEVVAAAARRDVRRRVADASRRACSSPGSPSTIRPISICGRRSRPIRPSKKSCATSSSVSRCCGWSGEWIPLPACGERASAGVRGFGAAEARRPSCIGSLHDFRFNSPPPRPDLIRPLAIRDDEAGHRAITGFEAHADERLLYEELGRGREESGRRPTPLRTMTR